MPSPRPFTDAAAALRALWAARWAGGPSVPVLWGANETRDLPGSKDTLDWVHLLVEFSGRQAVAFGGGRGQAEREATGRVQISVMSRRGTGEARNILLLDDAVGVFEGRRELGLSFIGDGPAGEGEPSADGAWWVRQASVPFVFRYRA